MATPRVSTRIVPVALVGAATVAAAVLVARTGGEDGPRETVSAGASTPAESPTAATAELAAADPVVAAVGDIACSPYDRDFNAGNGRGQRCRHAAVAAKIRALNPAYLLVPGDLQYENGSLRTFRASYDKSFGSLKDRTKPVPGNHEYRTRGADGYFDYFGSGAGARGKGYYSFNVGAHWRVYAINSNCTQVGCGRTSAQYRWLRDSLDTHRDRNVLAVWHHARYSSGKHGNATYLDPIWDLLVSKGVDVAVTGHDHTYERFAPLNASGARDSARGLRQFVVGTGGKDHHPYGTVKRYSERRNNVTHGAFTLTLKPDSYTWRFHPVAGGTFTDSGTGSTH